ncbi:MAG: GDP-mannose 4,6-dehydratase [Firmicutes bacterium]|nr:GDP-mannose 4,6-dehydratase [Bacillota bacterium]
MNTVLVTGADGFVGSFLVKHLLHDANNFVVAAVGPRAKYIVTEDGTRTKYVPINVTDSAQATAIMKKFRPQQVYHLAGIAVTHGVGVQDYMTVNAIGAYNLAASLLEVCGSDSPFLFVSSSAVYGNALSVDPIEENTELRPRSPYGASKAAAEAMLWSLFAKGLCLKIARPFNHTGPGQSRGFVCPDFAWRLRELLRHRAPTDSYLSFEIDGADNILDFTDVRDVVRAYEDIATLAPKGSVMNVASGKPILLREIADILCEVSGASEIVGVRAGSSDASHERRSEIGSTHRVNSLNGWSPDISIKRTLSDLWESVSRLH